MMAFFRNGMYTNSSDFSLIVLRDLFGYGRDSNSTDSDLKCRFPERLKTLASNVIFSEGNRTLHQFVLDNSYPNISRSENCINAVLLSMCDSSVNALNYEGYSALHLAVLKDNILMVRKLLSCCKTLDVNLKCNDNNTALHLAAKTGCVLIMQELVNNGADVNARGAYFRTPYLLAVLRGNLDIVQILRRSGCDRGVNTRDRDYNTALHLAAKYGHAPVVQELLCDIADVKAQGEYGRTPLHLAVEGGHLNVVEMLLKSGSDVNAKDYTNYTALHLAAKVGCALIIQELLNNGANVNVYSKNLKTPYLWSVENGHLDIVQILQRSGSNVNTRDIDKNTALHLAAKYGHAPVVHELLNDGADVKAQDKYLRTPLHWAVQEGNLNIVEMLLKSGSNVNTRDFANNTALHIAVEAGNIPIIQELLKNGAKQLKHGLFNAFLPLKLPKLVRMDYEPIAALGLKPLITKYISGLNKKTFIK